MLRDAGKSPNYEFDFLGPKNLVEKLGLFDYREELRLPSTVDIHQAFGNFLAGRIAA
jgi:hypothetical protein